jgi:ATP-dependent Clp protease ATP-binding subunit ClpA
MNWFEKVRKRLTEPLPSEYVPSESIHNFTPRAQQLLSLARKEAVKLNQNFVGTEHLLLGLVALGQGVAVNVLQNMGVDLQCVQAEVKKLVGLGPEQKVIGDFPYTPRVKKVLAIAWKEAGALSHKYVGTEHIVLGLLREGGGIAARVLKSMNVDIEQTRQEILNELDPNFSSNDDTAKPSVSKETAPLPNLGSPAPNGDLLDTSKRYDVYCAEGHQKVVVYRNALFKGTKALLPQQQYGTACTFMELERANGQTIFITRSSIIKFCEHRDVPNAGTVSGEEP